MVFLYGPMYFLENVSIAFIICQPLPGQYEYCSDREGGTKYNPLSVPLKVWLLRLQWCCIWGTSVFSYMYAPAYISMQVNFAHLICSTMYDDEILKKLERTGGMCLLSMDYDINARGRENVCPYCPLQSSVSQIVFFRCTQSLWTMV